MADPARVRAGDGVRIRNEQWYVRGLVRHGDCSVLEVAGAESSNRGVISRFLLPFEAADPLPPRNEQPRLVRPSVLKRAVRRILSDATPRWTSLQAAVGSRLWLMPFQLEPAMAMIRGHASRFLLADEVGLGKTVEAGLMLAEMLAREPEGRALIVTPAGLREQWEEELRQRFGIAAEIYDAAGVARTAARLPPGKNPWSIPRVIIASIDFIKRPDVLRSLEPLVWDLVVFDEAHLLAGFSDRATAARLLGSRGRRIAIVTATPHSGDEAAFHRLCGLGRLSPDDPLLIFRRGRDAAGWARSRYMHFLGVRPSAAEARMHRELHAYAREVWRRAPSESAAGARLAMVVLARRACSSAASLERSVRRRMALLSGASLEPVSQLELPLDEGQASCDAAPGEVLSAPGLTSASSEREWLERIRALAGAASADESKMAALRRLLRRIDEPAIVFTEYRDTLTHIAQMLPAHDAPVLHGGMDSSERTASIHRFTHGEARLLLATDAASEGLNLHQRCRVVMSLEAPWAALRLEQRAGRVDRIGQRHRAHAITFVARDTIEDGVVALRLRKQLERVRHAAPLVRADGEVIHLAEEAFGNGASRDPAAIALPVGVQFTSLRGEAVAEATRLRCSKALAFTGQLPGRHGRTERRAPAAILGDLSGPLATMYWAIRLLFVDDHGSPVWETLSCPTAIVGVPSGLSGHARPGAVCRWIRDTTGTLAPALAAAVAWGHADHLAMLTHDLAPVVGRLIARETNVVESIRLNEARLAASLVQPSLFDRRALQRAEAQRRILEDTLARSAEHIARLRRLLSPSAGERLLAFVIAR